jgi:hypothetical protein
LGGSVDGDGNGLAFSDAADQFYQLDSPAYLLHHNVTVLMQQDVRI